MNGAELRAIRERLGLTRAELAVFLGGYDVRTIGRWENEERKVPKAVETILTEADRKGKRKS